ncbi:MAG: TenA family protein [Pseudonocardiaceae bacterium]
MRDELSAAGGLLLAKTIEHPFWDGLRNGTLRPDSLWYFAEQDTRYVVPTYARALARAAAIADQDAYSAMLCAAASATFDAVTRMTAELTTLAKELGRRVENAAVTPAGRTLHGHVSFMVAATTTSFAAGIGGLLPMTWFHLKVSSDLKERRKPGSRYVAWINRYCPGEGYQEYVNAYLDMVDEVGGRCSASERDQLVEHFLLGARYELAFADAAWQRQAWAS